MFCNLPVFINLLGWWKILRILWVFEALKSFYLIYFHELMANFY
jgi:hypothetical protein